MYNNNALPMPKSLSHNELVRVCAHPCENWNEFWDEFQSRFDGVILLFIVRQAQKLVLSNGHSPTELMLKNLRQDVYIHLLKDKAEAMRNFRGESDQAIFPWLNIIAKDVVQQNLNSQTSCGPTRHLEYLHLHSPNMQHGADDPEWQSFKKRMVCVLNDNWHSSNGERDIQIFEKYYFQGLPPEEIQKDPACELPTQSIKSLLVKMSKLLSRVCGLN